MDATVKGQCLEYLGYITLAVTLHNFSYYLVHGQRTPNGTFFLSKSQTSRIGQNIWDLNLNLGRKELGI